MEAAVYIGLFLTVVAIIWGGVALRSHVARHYSYNIFSIFNLTLSFTAIISFWMALAALENGALTANSVMLAGFGAAIYLLLFALNAKHSSLMLAIVAVVYQALAGVLIVLFVLWLLQKLQEKKDARERLQR